MRRILAIGSLTLACGASEGAPKVPSQATSTASPPPASTSAESLTKQALQALTTDGENAARPLLEKALEAWQKETNEPVQWFDSSDGALSPRALEQSISAIDPTGSWLARSEENRITIFETNSWQRRWVFDAHKGFVRSLSFDPKGKLMWSSGADHTVRLWNLTTGSLVHTAPSQDHVDQLIQSSDGSRILYRCGHYLCSWKTDASVPEHQRLRLPSGCLTLRHWLEGQTLIAGKDGEDPCFFNITTGVVERTLPFLTGSLRFPRRGDTFLTALPTARAIRIEVWSASQGQRLRSLNTIDAKGNHAIPQTIPSLSPDGIHAIALTHRTQLTRWNTTTGEVVGHLALPSEVERADYLEDGRVLLSHAAAASFDLTNKEGTEVHPALQAPRMSYHTMEVAPDGKAFAVGVQDRVQLWSLETGKQTFVLHHDQPLGRTWSLRFSPDGRRLAVLHARGVRVWDLTSQAIVHEVPVQEGHRITSVGFDKQGRLITTHSVFPVPEGQDSLGGKILSTDLDHPQDDRKGLRLGAHTAIQLSDLGEHVAVAPPGRGIQIFNGSSGKLMRTLSVEGTWSLSPDGVWIAYVGSPAASKDQTPSLQLVRLSDGKEWTLDQVVRPIGTMAWKPDGSVIAVSVIRSVGGHEVLLIEPRSREIMSRVYLGVPMGTYYLTLFSDGVRMVTRHREGGMSFHRLKDGAVVASLGFMSDGETWMAWTDPGKFDMGGPRAQELIGCRVGARILPFALCATKYRIEGLLGQTLSAELPPPNTKEK